MAQQTMAGKENGTALTQSTRWKGLVTRAPFPSDFNARTQKKHASVMGFLGRAQASGAHLELQESPEPVSSQ